VTGAIEFLGQWLRPTDLLVEFGSGRSTVWFAERVGRVVSIEHDRAWHARVTQRLVERGLTNVSYKIVDDRLDPGRPVNENQLEHPEKYLALAEESMTALGPNARADVILVDGCSRDHCAQWALTHVKPGGLIVIDNANWYLPVHSRSPASVPPDGNSPTILWRDYTARTASWRRVWYSNGVTDTAIFFSAR